MLKDKREKDIEGIRIQNSRRKQIPMYLIAILIGVLSARIISSCIVSIGEVNTLSMVPTIMEGNKVVINKCIKDYSRGDIVVLKAPDKENKLYTKRVIGVGGDTVSIEDGIVCINKAPIKEGYILYSDSYNMDEIKIPDGEYFLLGDNRLNSMDSRYWEGNTVKKEMIIGKVVYIIGTKSTK